MSKRREMQSAFFDAYTAAHTALLSGRDDPIALYRFTKARQSFRPTRLVALDETMRRRTRLLPLKPPFWHRILPQHEPAGLLDRSAAWARVAIHSGDGRMRECAVRLLHRPEDDPMDLAALLCRCNDHVPEVRNLALARWAELCRSPDPGALVALLPCLLDRVANWQRGGQHALTNVKERPDYRKLLETMFLTETDGPLAKRLRKTLESEALDSSVGLLAFSARSPFVRAIATQVVLEGVARWQTGQSWQWVDKTISLRRRIPEWETRKVLISDDLRSQVFRAASYDRAVGVRKLAADHLIAVGPKGVEQDVARLRNDKKYAVKWRMDYFDKKWSGENSDAET